MMSQNCQKPTGIRNKKAAGSVLLSTLLVLLLFCNTGHAQAVEEAETQKAENTKKVIKTENSSQKQPEKADNKQDIDWGDWDTEFPETKTENSFGVGIQGKIEAELSRIDKSNLLQNATGVATTAKANNTGSNKKPKDLKKTMAELEALEAKVKKEIEDDSEF